MPITTRKCKGREMATRLRQCGPVPKSQVLLEDAYIPSK